MSNIIYATICILSIFVVSCRKQTEGTIIARVGETVLTLEEAKVCIDTSQGPFQNQLNSYVKHWITEELLFQEASRKGIENDEQYQLQIRDVQRQLATQRFIERAVYGDTISLSDSLLMHYFEAHRAEFFIREDMIKLNYVIFNTREQASMFAAKVSRGALWQDAISNVQNDSTLQASLLYHSENQFSTKQTINPPELWKIAATLNSNEVSFPVKTAMGYCVLQPLDKKKRGDTAEFEIVRDEIRERVLIKERRNKYKKIINDLHRRYKVEILIPEATNTDTIAAQLYE
ncbi:MAG: peptidylprolyl isomerase [Bacteroidota bacterium]|nr:peptidylprolyl isomerase [Bacteroidota bacterium]